MDGNAEGGRLKMNADTINSGTLNIITDGVLAPTLHSSETLSKIIVDLDFYDYEFKDNQLILTKKEVVENEH